MEWLAQNWISIVLVIGLIVMMRCGGMGCGGGRHRHRGQGATSTEPTIDPVSQQEVDLQTALTSVYQGKIYYFVSRENRDLFEAAPEQYATKEHGHGCC